jgi:hypothetical protein
MAEVLRIASQISTPIGLAGFAFATVFLIVHQLIKSNKFPKLAKNLPLKLVDRLVLLAIIAMAFAIVSKVYARPRTLIYRGAVLDAVSGDTIEGASVLILGRPEFYPATTDAHGSFTVQAATYEVAVEARAQVKHANYKTWSENRRITDVATVDIIKLTPVEKQEPADVTEPVRPPACLEYRMEWVKADESGQLLAETFGPITTENRHNRSDIIASGSFSLSNPQGRIYAVEYACQGYPCGWSYNPNGGYEASVKISPDGRSFTWYRKWDGDPATEVYKALYEVQKSVCTKVSN